MVRRVRSDGGRTVGVMLTDAGECRAQHIAAESSLLDFWPWDLFAAIERRTTPGKPVELREHVNEDDLISMFVASFEPPTEWNRTQLLAEIQGALVPMLARGWLESGSTVYGNVRYWLGPLAHEADGIDVSRPSISDERAKAGRSLYIAEFDRHYRALDTDEPEDDNDLGFIPLPCSARHQAELDAWHRSAAMAKEGK